METKETKRWRQVRRGDKTAAAEMLNRHYGAVFNYLWRLCGHEHTAEDLTQETFRKAWVKLRSCRGAFKTWIHTIAYRTYVDWLRSNGHAKTVTTPWWEDMIEPQSGPSENTEQKLLAAKLHQAVARLDEEQKQIVHLRYYQGFTIRETARILAVTSKTVKNRLRAIQTILRSEMKR